MFGFSLYKYKFGKQGAGDWEYFCILGIYMRQALNELVALKQLRMGAQA